MDLPIPRGPGEGIRTAGDGPRPPERCPNGPEAPHVKRKTTAEGPGERRGTVWRRPGLEAGAGRPHGSHASPGPVPPLDGLLAGLRLALGTGDPRADAAALSGVADWDAVAGLAAYHRVAPLLVKGLGTGGVRLAGSGIEPRLGRLRGRALIRGLGQLAALKQAAGALAENDLPCIVLKGLPLGRRLHGDLLTREAIDIDLLVSPDAFAGAERALRARGWRRIFPDFRETPVRKRWCEALAKESVLSGPSRAGGRGPTIELHRRLLNNPFLLDVPFERLYANGCTVEIEGHAFRILGDEDLLPYLACHGLEHYWHRLKWLCDIAVLLRSIDDDRLGRVVARCREEGLESALAPAFALCAEALHTAMPRAAASLPSGGRRAALIARFARRAWEGREVGAWRRIGRDFEKQAARFFMKTDLRYGLHELAKCVIAPHDFRWVDLPDKLFFLYGLLRPFAWVARRLRGRP